MVCIRHVYVIQYMKEDFKKNAVLSTILLVSPGGNKVATILSRLRDLLLLIYNYLDIVVDRGKGSMKTSLGLLNCSKVGSSGLSNLRGIFQRKGRCTSGQKLKDNYFLY